MGKIKKITAGDIKWPIDKELGYFDELISCLIFQNQDNIADCIEYLIARIKILEKPKKKKKVYLKKIKALSKNCCTGTGREICYFFIYSKRCNRFDCKDIIYVQVPKPNGGK